MKKYLFIILALLLIVNYLNIKKGKKEISYNFTKKKQLAKQINKKIIGKKINIKDDLNIEGHCSDISHTFILYYNGYDCSACTKRGFEIIKKLQKIKTEVNFYIIGTETNVVTDMLNFKLNKKFKNYIYNDTENLLRQKYGSIYTPVILKIKKETIEDYYCIFNDTNIKKISNEILNNSM